MIDARLQTALRPCGLPVYPNVYTGKELEYLVTNYTVITAAHGGDHPHAARYLVQVHYYLPHKKNPNPMLETLCTALSAQGFTAPDIVPASDANGQHYALECEAVDGGFDYGGHHA